MLAMTMLLTMILTVTLMAMMTAVALMRGASSCQTCQSWACWSPVSDEQRRKSHRVPL
jgi:hypothetical protein